VDHFGTDVLDGSLSPRYAHCERCGHALEDSEFELVEYQDGVARGFCSAGCRSWTEYHEGLTPADENDAHHLWDGQPDAWHRAL